MKPTILTDERKREIESRAAFPRTGRKGYHRAVENAVRQYHREDYGSAELFTRGTIVFTEIGSQQISLSIMTRKHLPAPEAEAFRNRVLSLIPVLADNILREEKRHNAEEVMETETAIA